MSAIPSSVLIPYIKMAAIDVKVSELTADGYTVERGAQLGDAVADIVARKGEQTLAYHAVVAGSGGNPALGGRLSAAARAAGAGFHMLLVNPQLKVGIDVKGAEAIIADAVRKALPAEVFSHIANPRINEVAIEDSETRITGVAAIMYDLGPPPTLWQERYEGLALDYTIWFAPDRTLTRPPLIHIERDEDDEPLA